MKAEDVETASALIRRYREMDEVLGLERATTRIEVFEDRVYIVVNNENSSTEITIDKMIGFIFEGLARERDVVYAHLQHLGVADLIKEAAA